MQDHENNTNNKGKEDTAPEALAKTDIAAQGAVLPGRGELQSHKEKALSNIRG